MLLHLTIRNYALIRELEMSPSRHLSVITGETGAGKSIMLGAVGMLLGNRADSKVLLNEGDKCIVEGEFDIGNYGLQDLFSSEDLDYDKTTIIRREIAPSGKSRAFINDVPVTLDILKKVGSVLMDVHSQHDTLLLADGNFQLKVVDAFADNGDIRKEYVLLFKEFKKAKAAFDHLNTESAALQKEYEFNAFQLEELSKAKLLEEEQEELEAELQVLEHAEEIKVNFHQSNEILNNMDFGVVDKLRELNRLLRSIAPYAPNYEQLAARTESVSIEINDIQREIDLLESSVEFDQNRYTEVQDRLALIYKLQKKHGVQSNKELLHLESELGEKVEKVINLDDQLKKLDGEQQKLYKQLLEKGRELSKSRKHLQQSVCNQIVALLQGLGMPEARMEMEFTEVEPMTSGLDKVVFKFSANKGIPPEELKKVASGGEFSRLMFCFKYLLAGKIALPSIIFDEIDAGISGEVAVKMGQMMKKMSENHQVITITHLPQIAAKGDEHYFVYKEAYEDRSVSSVKKLEEEDRVKEIATMISGESVSTASFQSARELLALK